MSNQQRLREEFLRLLREDAEFRYAVLGLLGLDEVIRRLDENTAAIRALQEQVLSLQEQVKILQEQVKSLQEQTKALQEQVKVLQEQVKVLQEQVKILQEQVKALQDEIKKHAEILERHSRILEEHSKAIRELAAKIDSIGYGWGLVAEDTFRESIKYLIEDLLGVYRVSKWIYYDSEGLVYGYPSTVEVDVLIRDSEHVLVEFKSIADKADVAELYNIGRLYEKATGVKPRLLIVASCIRKRAKELADRMGIECRAQICEQIVP